MLDKLDKWFEQNGHSTTILSDQGCQFTSQEFQNEMKTNGSTSILCSPYSPTSNGVAERLNQVISFVLKHFRNLSIANAVKLAETRMRMSYHRGLKCSPIELTQQRHPLNLNPDFQFTSINSSVNQNREFTYQIGDTVYRKAQEQGKLAPKWDEPYTISEILPNSMTMILESLNRQIRTNIRNMRPY